MRKFIFTLSFLNLFAFTAATAQVAKWVIHPSYDHIRMLGDGYYIVSQNDKYGILDATEKEIVPLQYDSISPFNSHMGLLFNDGKCIGYTSDKGEVHDFSAHQFKIDSMSRFSDGYLAVYNPTGYWYVRAEDGSAIQMDTAAVIVNDRTFAPIRYLAEHFGFTVGWDGATKTVVIQ